MRIIYETRILGHSMSKFSRGVLYTLGDVQ